MTCFSLTGTFIKKLLNKFMMNHSNTAVQPCRYIVESRRCCVGTGPKPGTQGQTRHPAASAPSARGGHCPRDLGKASILLLPAFTAGHPPQSKDKALSQPAARAAWRALAQDGMRGKGKLPGERSSHGIPGAWSRSGQAQGLPHPNHSPRAQLRLESLPEPRSLCLEWGSRDLPPLGDTSCRLLCLSPLLPASSLFSRSSQELLWPLCSWLFLSPLLSECRRCCRCSSSRCILLPVFLSELLPA